MLEVLSREDINIKEMMDKVMSREVPDAWKVVGVHAKERELKVAPRLFAMMPLEMRIYFCITEMNIAHTIFRFFPQQTMTQNEADLTQRLLRVTEQRTAKKNVLPVVINLDFEKWNLNWRQESMHGTLTFLDNVFVTTGLFSYTHEYFESSMFYLVSRYCVPAGLTQDNRLCPPESATVWYRDGSGKEGIRQKGWTLATVGALVLVESLTVVFGTRTGQGDSQVIVAMFDIPAGYTREQYVVKEATEIKALVESYMMRLSQVFNSIGLPVKREESWMHLDIFAYGKDILYRGAVLPMAIKRIMHIMPDVNDVFPSLTNSLATLFAAGQASCSKGVDCSVPFFISFVEGALLVISQCNYCVLTGRPCFPRKEVDLIREDDMFLMFILTMPHALGGYPILSLLEFLLRGHPDPCTEGFVL
uniref:RdRp catalytic domain-containing protein n=1 Tax=Trichuris muris TaxID=70415 RepID=A0A5S6QMP5_TRIMR